MNWVGLNYDNAGNVVYQTRRFDRYKGTHRQRHANGYCFFIDNKT